MMNQKISATGLRRAVFSLLLLVLLATTGYSQVGLAPSISVQPSNQTVLVGGTATFQVVASSLTTMSYKWYRNGVLISGATSSTYSLANVQATNVGTFYVEVRNLVGPTLSSNATLTVLVPPALTTQPTNQTKTVGQSASFSVVASGTAPLQYQWRFNGADLPGATNATLALGNVQTNDAGSYSVLVTNVVGSVTSAVAALTVNVPAGIATQPASQVVQPGSNAVFSVVASGSAPLAYQWYFGNTSLAGATGSTLTLNNVQATNAGSYSVVVTNAYGSATSAVATLTVQSGWVAVVVNTNDSGAGSLRQAILSAAGGGAGTKTITFNITNAPVGGPYTIKVLSALPALTNTTTIDGYTQPGASKNTLSNGNNAVIKISVSGGGTATDGFTIGNPGCAIYGLAIVNFSGIGIRFNSQSSAIIQGNFIGLDPDGVTVRANSGQGIRSLGNPSVIGGPAPWQRNVISGNLGGGISLQNSPNNVIQGNFIGTDASGSLARGNTGIAVEIRNSNSYGNLVGGSNPGEGNVISATTGAGTNSHGIVLQGNLGNTIQGNRIGTDVTGTNALGNLGCGIALISYASVQLIGGTNAGAGNVIAYNSGAGIWVVDGIINGMLGNSIFSNGGLGIDLGTLGMLPNDAGDPDVGANNLQNYPVLINATNCGGTLQINGNLSSSAGQTYRLEFFSSPGPTAVTNSEGKTFLGATSLTLPGTAPVNFSVSFPSVSASDTVVTATATDSTNNTSELSAWVTIVKPVLTLTNQPQNQTVSVGQGVLLSVGASGTGPITYQWRFNGTNLAGATSATLALNPVGTNHAGSYSVLVANACNSLTSAVAMLSVLVPPTITSQPQSLTVTKGQSAAFSVMASGTSPFSYQWRLNGADVSGATNMTLTFTNARTVEAGNYQVMVANSAGSVTSAVASLTVLVPPAIKTQPFGQNASVGQNVAFTVTVSGTSPFAYQWSRNGTPLPGATGSTLTLNKVQTSNAASYTVVVTNSAGTVTSSSAILTVTDPLSVTPPCFGSGAMTPTGFAFNVRIPAGYRYLILASTNTRDWTQIYSNVALTTNVLFTDSAATNLSLQFYRAQVLPPVASAVLEQTTSGGGTERVRAGEKGAQSFRHGSAGEPSYTITKVVLHLSRDSTAPNTNLNFSIGFGINSAPLPGSSVAIAPSTLADSSSGSTFQTYEIIFSSPVGPLTAGTTYYLNLECEAGNGGRIYVESASDSAYSKGTYYLSGSASGEDVWFQLWGQ